MTTSPKPPPSVAKKSAGLLLFRRTSAGLEVLLVHPGGPYWAKKDDGAWSIPKGEFAEDEEPLSAAKRKFEEETGAAVDGAFIPLEPVRAAEWQDRIRVGAPVRLRSLEADEQPVHHGVAAEVRATAAVSGSRPCRVVRHRRGAGENTEGSGAASRPVAGHPCTSTVNSASFSTKSPSSTHGSRPSYPAALVEDVIRVSGPATWRQDPRTGIGSRECERAVLGTGLSA